MSANVFIRAQPNRNSVRFSFAVSRDQHVRHLLELRFADPVADLFVAFVDVGTDSGFLKLSLQFPFEVAVIVRNRSGQSA